MTVLPFANATGKAAYDALGVGLGDMILNDLAASTGLRVAVLPPAGGGAPPLDLAPARAAGATLVVMGTVQSVVPPRRREDFAAFQGVLVDKVLEVLAGALGPGDDARVKAAITANHPRAFAAALAYGQGLAARDRGDLEKAARSLRKAIAKEPAFSLGQGRCNDAVRALYYSKVTAQPPPARTAHR